MYNLTAPSQVRALLDRHGFHPKKGLGQNFLIDRNILERIVGAAGLSPGACVLEVGPGIGTLTLALSEAAAKVAAVEIDDRLIPILQETTGDRDNVTIIKGDILKADIAGIASEVFGGAPFAVVANLPYYITSPVIMRFLEEDLPVERMVVMVQKEVAQRLSALPGTKEWGALSVAAQLYADIDMPFSVPPTVFYPQPQVSSGVVRLIKRDAPLAAPVKSAFFALMRAGFSQRRKTLLNSLSALLKDRDTICETCATAGIDVGVRAESLSVGEWVALAEAVSKRGVQEPSA
jgi:16S rRNA (adenine1518-N6/adenine1519-N6)-dimethyltransferase